MGKAHQPYQSMFQTSWEGATKDLESCGMIKKHLFDKFHWYHYRGSGTLRAYKQYLPFYTMSQLLFRNQRH